MAAGVARQRPVNGAALLTSDGVAITDENLLTIEAASAAEILLFDLA
jgi:quercetin 2,3-dioxygenase